VGREDLGAGEASGGTDGKWRKGDEDKGCDEWERPKFDGDKSMPLMYGHDERKVSLGREGME